MVLATIVFDCRDGSVAGKSPNAADDSELSYERRDFGGEESVFAHCSALSFSVEQQIPRRPGFTPTCAKAALVGSPSSSCIVMTIP
jgi:hypothetical protein